MGTNILTVSEYAYLRDCSTKNVYNQIYAGRALEGISRYEKVGKTHILYTTKAFVHKHSKYFAQMLQK